MTSWLRAATEFADEVWESAASEQDFARAILTEGRRTWLMCGAIASTSVSVRVHPITSSLAITLGSMEAWLGERLEALRSDVSTIREMDEARELISAELTGFRESVEDLAADLGSPDLVNPGGSTVLNPLLEVAFDVPPNWFVLRNDIDILLAAPYSYQEEGVTGLGVPGWSAGTAVRLRRFRHKDPWALSDTVDLMASLYLNFGDQKGESPTVIDGNTAVTLTYESPEYRWTSYVAATFANQRSYLIEIGCPSIHAENCADLLQGLTGGVRLTSE
jgi:hypothetical protein